MWGKACRTDTENAMKCDLISATATVTQGTNEGTAKASSREGINEGRNRRPSASDR